ncbi:MAG: hypothetical protein GY859_16730 [Desulfobacterales bacterium]|nr:hypothetical protein [Desulfobacterales bacterium]
MRVTNNLMNTMVANQLFNQTEKLFRAEEVVASQKRIIRPSDDPVGMGKVLGYRQTLSAIDQYGLNMTNGKHGISYDETVLTTVEEYLESGRQIADIHSVGELSDRPYAIEEIDNIRVQMLSLGNAQLSGRYRFSGNKTDTPPFSAGGEVRIDGGVVNLPVQYGLAAGATNLDIVIRDETGAIVRQETLGDGVTPDSAGAGGYPPATWAWDGTDGMGGPVNPDGAYTYTIENVEDQSVVPDPADPATTITVPVLTYETYHGDNGQHNTIVGENMTIGINMDGDNMFGETFYRLARIQQGLEHPVPELGTPMIADSVDQLQVAIENLRTERTDRAAKYNRMELLEKRWERVAQDVESMRQDTEEADPVQAIIELKAQETAYQTTLQSAARVVQPTLLDFL